MAEKSNYTVESSMSAFLKEAIQKGVVLKRLSLEELGEKEKGKSWKPDFELETFIIAIQKMVIKDVVNYADKKIEATKSVIQN